MKKIALTLLFVFAAFTAYGVTETQVDVTQEFKDKIQTSLPEGWKLSYDDITGKGTEQSSEIRIKNLSIVSPDTSDSIKHQGEMVWTITESRTNITADGSFTFNNEDVVTAPVTIDIEIPKNVLFGQLFTPEFWQTFKKLDLQVGKGTFTNKAGDSTISSTFDEIIWKMNREKETESMVQVPVEFSLKNLVFSPADRAIFKQYPKLNPLQLSGMDPTDQGKINVSLNGVLKLPSYAEFLKLKATKDLTILDFLNKGYGADLTAVNNDDLTKSNFHLLLDFQADAVHLTWKTDMEMSELYTKKTREALIQEIITMPKEGLNPILEHIQQFAINKKEDLLNLFPTPHEWGKVTSNADITAKVTKEGQLAKADYDLSFGMEKPNYEILIKGIFDSNPNLPRTTTVTLVNYKQMMENSVNFYNNLVELYKTTDPNAIFPIISKETLQHYIDRIQELASTKSDKEVVIIIDYTDPKNPKIGDKPLMEAISGPAVK